MRPRLLKVAACGVAGVLLAAGLVAATPAWADTGAPITAGSLVYSQAPNGGSSPDKDQTGLVALSDSALTDGESSTGVQWVGGEQQNYTQVSMVFDLHRDHPLGSLRLVSNAPNRFYGITSFSVRVRAESDPDFTAVHSQSWYGTASPLPEGAPLNHTVTVDLDNRNARFVILTITRLHKYHHMPLNEVALVQGTDELGVAPAPPLSAAELRAQTGLPVKQVPRAGMVDVGNYLASVTPNDGTPDNAGGLFGFQYGKLFDRNLVSEVGWRGHATAPKTVSLVFDLFRDHPLSGIRIFSKSPNQFWSFDEITVTYRSENSESYRIATRAIRARTDTDYKLDVPMGNATARFVRIDLTRNNQYLHIPLSEVEFTIGSGSIGENPAPPLSADQMRQELSRYTRLVDGYGQYLYQNWPSKVTSDAQLQEEARLEAEQLADTTVDTVRYDRYGGMKALGNHGASCYFRLEKIDGRWWFVTPDGHLFFLKGVDSMSHEEWGYGTLYRNADGTSRDVFESLPDPGQYPDAYTVTERGQVVSFVNANLMRKYGADYENAWRDITAKRMIDWGFNAQSKWARDAGIAMPRIDQVTPPSDVIRVLWGIDPFDPEFGAKLDRHFDIAGKKTDPWLIGYFFDNERGWDRNVVAEVLKQSDTLPAKRAFVAYMSDTYEGDLARVNEILGTSAASSDQLAMIPLDIAKVPATDVSAFITAASKVYYSTVQASIRKQDPNHLFLGSALVPTWHSSLEWNVGGRDYVDAISLDVYTDNAGYLAEYERYDKPILNLEYSFNTHDRGLRSINAAARAASIAERGEKYRAFVEAQAESSVFVGSGWFVYYDQAVTGRPGDGESYNFGLLNQQDQPYTAMTDVMRDGNLLLELVHQTGTAALTPDLVASTITRLAPASPDLRLPRLPREFQLGIASTDRPDVIDADGTVTSPAHATVVTLVLSVTKTTDGTSAQTGPLRVLVPAR